MPFQLAKASMEVLRETFQGCIISLCGDIHWPAHLPDLFPCNYFLWGYLKDQVFKCRPQVTDKLKDFIHHEIALISVAMTSQVLQNFRVRPNKFSCF